MKAEELMIGDWVDVYHELTDESGFYKPLRVTGIHYNDGICFGDSTIESPWNDLKEFEEGVRPIPLTPEILEKNGFEKHISDIRMFFQHGEYHLSYYIVNKHFTIYNQIDGSLIQRVIVNVHELQHALKLCGIDKEIIV